MKTFKQYIQEDGMGAGAVAAGPTNVVGSGSIAGTGGKGGEPGVDRRKKKNPIMIGMERRNLPK
jgi:hypothetical protein